MYLLARFSKLPYGHIFRGASAIHHRTHRGSSFVVQVDGWLVIIGREVSVTWVSYLIDGGSSMHTKWIDDYVHLVTYLVDQ